MTNEVINETEDSTENETSAINETNNQVADENSGTEQPMAVNTEVDSDEETSATGEDFGAILEKFEQEQTVYHSGELVTGKVIGVSDHGVMVDFGYKSEGLVPLEEFMSPEGEIMVKKGDEVEVVIRSIHTGDAPPALSRFDALSRKSWEIIEDAFREERPIIGIVTNKTKGGLKVDIDGVEAFLPGSQIDSRPIRSLDSYIGQEIEAKIIKCNRRRNNIVLSRKVLTDAVMNVQKAETLNNIEEGYIIEGTVKNLTEYGAFVDIGGIDGLLHVTDMSWSKQQNPGALFKPGENIQVKILKLDREKEKVSLGFKQLIPNPWVTAAEVYQVGEKVTGRISTVTEYGAFIELEPQIEGLVHISEMSWSKRTKSPKKFLKPGDEVEVQILGIDSEDHRISLGMKQLMPNPWETVRERYHVGDRIHGKVRNITDFGVFVEIEDGVDGLVHVSDISWSKKVKHPKDVLSRDEEVDAIITGIDTAGRRMSLSIKDITPSAWETFVATHKIGDTVKGKITRIADFGIFAELGDELEGLCHISELSDDRIDRPEDVVKIGQEMDFKILRIEFENRKIALSARAAGSSESASGDSRSYTTEAKGGMASLGELMNIKFGRSSEETPAEETPKLSKKERKALKALERAAAAESGEEQTSETTEEPIETATESTETLTDAVETETTESTQDSAELVEAESAKTTEESAESIEIESTETIEESTESSELTEESVENSTNEPVAPSAEVVEPAAEETLDESIVPESESEANDLESAETGDTEAVETEEKTANS
ncbi:hypothetical protein BH10ACI1_BH10ACI1_24500 [soil metagenome]